MRDVEDMLPGLLDGLGQTAPHDPELADHVRAGVRRRRRLTLGPMAAILAVCVVLGGIWVTRPGGGTADAIPNTAPSACQPLDTGPLPEWARAGFSSPAGNPFSLSDAGSMVAVVFANPLLSPAPPDAGNKILWVPEQIPAATDTLVITGHLEGGDPSDANAATTVNTGTAPGPSYVDVPAPGCWRLDLTWGPHTDTMFLRWAAG